MRRAGNRRRIFYVRPPFLLELPKKVKLGNYFWHFLFFKTRNPHSLLLLLKALFFCADRTSLWDSLCELRTYALVKMSFD